MLAREPVPQEIDRARRFLNTQAEMIRKGKQVVQQMRVDFPSIDSAQAAAWVDFSLALLNCNEFLYVP